MNLKYFVSISSYLTNLKRRGRRENMTSPPKWLRSSRGHWSNYAPWYLTAPFIWDWMIIYGISVIALAFAPKIMWRSLGNKVVLMCVCEFSLTSKDKQTVFLFKCVTTERPYLHFFTALPLDSRCKWHCYLPHDAKLPSSRVPQGSCLRMAKHKAADPCGQQQPFTRISLFS